MPVTAGAHCPGLASLTGLVQLVEDGDGLGLGIAPGSPAHRALRARLEMVQPAAAGCTRLAMLDGEPDPTRRMQMEEIPCPSCPFAAEGRVYAALRG